MNHHGIESDNTAFTGFGVPNANLVYKDDQEMMRLGPIHYAAHIHAPYDTPELAREVGDVLEQMTHVALTAVLKTERDAPELRVAPGRSTGRSSSPATPSQCIWCPPPSPIWARRCSWRAST